MLSYNKVESKENIDWVVFIHGMGGSSNAFKKQIDAYKKKYNLMLIDLHGHGRSAETPLYKKAIPSFDEIIEDIIKVLDHEGIEEAHFVGLSLGSLIIRGITEIAPERITTITCAGAVLDFNWKINAMLLFGNAAIHVLPYMFLYRLFAMVMLPRKNHKKSREIFVNEAEKLGSKEFFAWFKLVQSINKRYPVDNFKLNNIPKLLIMGEEDHMFIKASKKFDRKDQNTRLWIIKKCGHISNLEAPEEFNEKSLEFIDALNTYQYTSEEYSTA